MESILPSPREKLALALAIVKSTPAHLDIKEYILQVRQFIKSSRDTETFHPREQFFDSVAFWKQAYDNSEAEQIKLRDRIYELEQSNEILLTEVRAQEMGLIEERKKIPGNGDSGHPTSRSRTQLYPMRGLLAIGAQDLDTAEDSTVPFMRQFYILQKALQRRSKNSDITRPAVDLCKRCTDELEKVRPQESNPTGTRSKGPGPIHAELSRLNAIIRAIESAVSLNFQALGRISASEPDGRDANILIYHIVGLYETIMSTLGRYCRVWASRKPASLIPKFSAQGPTTRSKASAGWDAQIESEKEEATLLTSLLNGMITALNPSHTEQQSLMEGFFCILLSRVGRLLCIFNFRDLQLRPELRADPSILPLPAGLVDTELDDQSLDAMCTEAKHLVWLLKRALAVFNIWSPAPNSESGDHPPKTQFVCSIKAKLEKTLTQAVFGANPDSGPRLESPALPENMNIARYLRSHRVPQLSVPDWYISEVWGLIGWKVLTSTSSS
ncbi:hypothetical protein BJX64DRAFT_286587 [Aspergillus heterothallicus]